MNISETLDFVKSAHKDQKYGAVDYWCHTFSVSEMGKLLFGSKFTEDAYQMALLHDVIEDTSYTLEDLLDLGVDEEIVSGVELLTKKKDLTYNENIDRIIKSSNQDALMVKIADNMSNLTCSMESFDTDKRTFLIEKYGRSLIRLSQSLLSDK
jgi:(p)ppGpp synthase/HD superfamily hydrolase